MLIKLAMPIIVEGKYDKITLENVVDTLIISTDGFRIFKNKDMCDMIRRLANQTGIIIMTDSDSAGQVIRNHIKNIAASGKIINVYVPQLKGKEKRKATASKEGFLGVEGLSKDILQEALLKFGINGGEGLPNRRKITKADFYEFGLSGHQNSGQNRKRLLKALQLPQTLSSTALLDVANTLYSFEEFSNLCKNEFNL